MYSSRKVIYVFIMTRYKYLTVNLVKNFLTNICKYKLRINSRDIFPNDPLAREHTSADPH